MTATAKPHDGAVTLARHAAGGGAADFALRRGRLVPLEWAASGAMLLLVVAAAYGAHSLLVSRGAPAAGPALAIVDGGTTQPVRARDVVAWRDENGVIRRGQVDEGRLAQFRQERHEATKAARTAAHEQVRTVLPAALQPIFAAAAERAPGYADWYFSYTSKYVLMGHALAAAGMQVIASPPVSSSNREVLTQAIVEHLTEYLRQQYSNRVLHPRAMQADIQAALGRTLGTLREGLARHIAAEQAAIQSFIQTEIRSAEVVDGEAASRLALDWDGQAQGLGLAPWRSSALHRYRRGLLDIAFEVPSYDAADSASPIEHFSGEEGFDEIAHVIVNLFGKVVDPVASEMGNVAIGLLAGGIAAGAAAAPPMAAVIGLGVGVGSEILSNPLEETLTRPEFERGLQQSIEVMRDEIAATMIAVFDRNIDAWVDGVDKGNAAE